MTEPAGFGKPKQPKPTSKHAETRAAASKQYDEMKAEGLPEFTIFIRMKDQKTWFPVGSIAVKRSNQINQAIFRQEGELLQGALRLFPVLRKNQTNLEYGYRLKAFADEPIQVAVRPEPRKPNPLQQVMNQTRTAIAGVFNRKA